MAMPKHHYLPRFYLANFTDPQTPTGQEPYVWVCATTAGWKKRAPRNVAARSGYYAIPASEGTTTEDIEHLFGQAESVAASILRDKVLKEVSPSFQERAELAYFLGLMMARMPKQIEHVGSFMAEVSRTILSLYYQGFKRDPRRWEAFKENYRKETGRADFDDVNAEDLSLDRIKITTETYAALGMSITGARIFGEILPGMGWTFWVSRSDEYFITSDFPVSIVDPVTKNESPGLAFRHVEVSFPASRQIALVTGWLNEGTTRWRLASTELIEQINIRTAMRATQLIAPDTSFPGSATLLGGKEHRDRREAEQSSED